MKGLYSDDELRELMERNEQRAREMREAMGTLYVCHPSNRVEKLDGSSRRTGGDRGVVAAPRQMVLVRSA